MELIVAPAVKAGDRVAIVAPASPVSAPLLEAGIAVLKSWGLVPVVHWQVWSQQGYLAGSDEERANALVEVFDDPGIAAVVCANGGYGCTRLLELLQPCRLGAHNLPRKRFFGFSDITALHSLMRVAVPGYVSFHAPMPAVSLFVEGTELSRESLRLALFAPTLQSACPPIKGRCLQMGRAKNTNGVVSGRLIGGNLTVYTSILGTQWQDDAERCILLLEDVNEAAYRLDRMCIHFESVSGNVGILHRLEALVLGDFGGALQTSHLKEAIPDVTYTREAVDKFWLEQKHMPPNLPATCTQEEMEKWFWLDQMRLPPDLPVLSGLPIGHIDDNRTVPMGAYVNVDMKTCTLSVASGVSQDTSQRSRL
ncbi:hypothetical protein KC19_5G141000 [Ceratodon purpureus]|uniref:LD-carboxypeptidase n=1 Tax=Ceratodon purpureus TaxID=3225 RepID=A0A8T0I1C7_CERPU|nr:hypothetical protein KC19_5G141000 [Ceratodon purpureus]